MKLIMISVFIGNLTVTSYRPVKEQTDSTPFNTSTTEYVRSGGVAVSRDLLCGACRKLHWRCKHPEYAKKIHYGDWLYVEDYGFRQVNDIMGEYRTSRVKGKKVKTKITNQIDLFVWTYKEEKRVNVKRKNVWVVKELKELSK